MGGLMILDLADAGDAAVDGPDEPVRLGLPAVTAGSA
jgi:hypothetical protein